MKRFKQIDLAISILLIAGFAAWYIYDTGILFRAYFTIGGWQVISMLVHAFGGWFIEKGSARVTYNWVTFTIVSMGALAFVIPAFLVVYYIMLFAAPVMAVIYCLICRMELKKLNKRPLDLV